MTCPRSQSEAVWAQGLCVLAVWIHKSLGLPSTGGQAWQQPSMKTGSTRNKPYSFTGTGDGGDGWAGLAKESCPPPVCLEPYPKHRIQK